VIYFCDNFASCWFLGFPLVILSILCFWSIMSVGLEVMGLGPVWGRPRWLSAYFWPRLKSPYLLRCLSIAIEGGRPIPEALQRLAERQSDVTLRRRFIDIADAVERGENCWIVLRAAQMLTRGEPALLEAARRVGNLVWALRGMADSIERRAEYRYQIILELIDPVLVLCLGALVGTFAISMFLPLIELLNKLS
jgi:type II secretory pathway component PulF